MTTYPYRRRWSSIDQPTMTKTDFNYGIPAGLTRYSEASWFWYYIEDYEDGQPMVDHFFGSEYRPGTDARFRIWSGGGGGWRVSTFEEARVELFNRVKEELETKRDLLLNSIAIIEESLTSLGSDPARIERFNKPPDWTPVGANLKAKKED